MVRIVRSLLLVLAVCAGPLGCAPLRSVRATAQLGARLLDSSDVLANAPRYCDLAQALSMSAQDGGGPLCDRVTAEKDARLYVAASDLLARYALILNNFVDPTDITYKQTTVIWPAGGPAADAFTTAAAGLFNLVTKTWRHKQIQNYVHDVDLEPVFTAVEGHTLLMIQLLQGLGGDSGDPRGRLSRERQVLRSVPRSLAAECQKRKARDVFCSGGEQALGNLSEATIAGLWNVQSWVEHELLAILRYRRTLRSFHVAYTTLRTSNPRTWDDDEVYGLIGKRIEQVAQETATARDRVLHTAEGH